MGECLHSAEVTEHNGPAFRDVVNSIRNFEAREADRDCDGTAKSVGATTDASFRGIDATTNAAARLAKDICESDAKTAHYFKELSLQVCKAEDGVKDSLNTGFTATQVSLVTGFKDTEIAFKEAQGLAYQIEGRSALLATTNQGATMLEMAKNQAATMLAFCQASKEAALCCCELKALVTSDGNTTRALINSQETDRLRDRANRAENAINAYFSAKVPPITPVP